MNEPNTHAPATLQTQQTSPLREALALAVKAAREELGWTQAELAEATRTLGIPVSKRTVSWVETGGKDTRMGTVEALAKALGTTGMGLMLEGEAIARRQR